MILILTGTVCGLYVTYMLKDILKTSDRGNLLIGAVKAKDIPRVQYLLQSGVNPNFISSEGTPLKLAHANGDVEIVVLLKKYGAIK